MIDDQMLITWSCERCKDWGRVNLLNVASKRGIDYCLVDKVSTCKAAGCGGLVHFHYSPGQGTPSRPLKANRERQASAQARAAQQEMRIAHAAYNVIARRLGYPTLPPFDWIKR